MKDRRVVFAIITTVIGFMLAIQFQTTNEPIVRDTRDILELRKDLTAEKERQQELNNEIKKYETLLSQYEDSLVESVMEEAIDELKNEVGLTEATGPGIIIEVTPIFNDGTQHYYTVPPELLRRLINELNIHGAKEIAIGNQRIVTTSAIRDVNGVTHINARRIPPFPLKILVLTDDPERLHNEMIVSQSLEYFAIENLSLSITPVNEITLPAYEQILRVRYMEQVKEEA
ncbi:DUF881 domain-containing protein [Anaerobacillus sp. MEB173]|uniref:DUF881 domain-containing protein n=1 Tax=Anaerobacillus sp. MEB173 TaxID=3383345 RepID=UPI003F90CF19